MLFYVELAGRKGFDFFCSVACMLKIWPQAQDDRIYGTWTHNEYLLMGFRSECKCFECNSTIFKSLDEIEKLESDSPSKTGKPVRGFNL